MIERFPGNRVFASGTAGNIKPVKIFDSGKRMVEFSINADYKDGAAEWVSVKAWNQLADMAARIQKGDCVVVTGRNDRREYNGKIYESLVADCIVGGSVVLGDAAEPPAYQPGVQQTEELEDELPF